MLHCASKRLNVKIALIFTYQLIIQIISHSPHLDSSRLECPYAQSKHQHCIYVHFVYVYMCTRLWG
jgi:hypothetical protein